MGLQCPDSGTGPNYIEPPPSPGDQSTDWLSLIIVFSSSKGLPPSVAPVRLSSQPHSSVKPTRAHPSENHTRDKFSQPRHADGAPMQRPREGNPSLRVNNAKASQIPALLRPARPYSHSRGRPQPSTWRPFCTKTRLPCASTRCNQEHRGQRHFARSAPSSNVTKHSC